MRQMSTESMVSIADSAHSSDAECLLQEEKMTGTKHATPAATTGTITL